MRAGVPHKFRDAIECYGWLAPMPQKSYFINNNTSEEDSHSPQALRDQNPPHATDRLDLTNNSECGLPRVESTANPADDVAHPGIICGLCSCPFELSDARRLHRHLSRHLHALLAEGHCCSRCNIAFLHMPKLHDHLHCASHDGNCGAEFKHFSPCTGHHADFEPSQAQDHLSFCIWLRQSKHAALARFLDSVALPAQHHVDILDMVCGEQFTQIAASPPCITGATTDGGVGEALLTDFRAERLRVLQIAKAHRRPARTVFMTLSSANNEGIHAYARARPLNMDDLPKRGLRKVYVEECKDESASGPEIMFGPPGRPFRKGLRKSIWMDTYLKWYPGLKDGEGSGESGSESEDEESGDELPSRLSKNGYVRQQIPLLTHLWRLRLLMLEDLEEQRRQAHPEED